MVIRSRRNKIGAICKNGNWIHNEEEIADYFIKNFQDLFTSDQPQFSQDLDDLLPSCITDEENGNLMHILLEEEIKETAWKLHLLKSSGLDGFSRILF